MSNGYFVTLKCKNVFNSSITKLFFFKNINNAYEYGINIEPYIKRELLNTLETSIQTNILWASSQNVFPHYICKIYEVSNDVILNIYHSTPMLNSTANANLTHLIKEIYKNIKLLSLNCK